MVDDKIILSHPLPLDDEMFAKMVKQDLETYYPEYLEAIAKSTQLDPVLNREEVLEKGYTERVRSLLEEVILKTLDERPVDAYDSLKEACFFSEQDLLYIKTVEGDNADTNMFEYVKKRLDNVSHLKPTLQFVEAVNDAELYLVHDLPNFNSYKASSLIDSMETAQEGLLDNEGKAVIDFISSKLYRKLNADYEKYGAVKKDSKEEIQYLLKVLEKTSDYRLISYCQSRLPEEKYQKMIVRAYQRALRKKQTRNNLYKINTALADLYMDRTKIIGFCSENSDTYKAAQKSLQYLTGAYHHGDKTGKKNALKKMAVIYLKFGQINEWKELKEVVAMNFLEKSDRCEALIAIADKTKDVSYYRKALQEAQKARMPANVRNILFNKIYGRLASSLPDGDERNSYLQKQKNLGNQNNKLLFLYHSHNDKKR